MYSVASASASIRNSLILGDCSLLGTVSASGSLSSDHSCVDETSGNHTSVVADSDLGAFVPISGVTGGYYPLVMGSRANGAGSSAHCLSRDQRNSVSYLRSRSACDAGAIRFDGLRPTATITLTPTVTLTPSTTPTPLPAHNAINVDSGCTLTQAINSANNNSQPSGSTCEVGSSTLTDRIELDKSYTLSEPLPDITSNMTIDGNGYTLTGSGAGTDKRMVGISGGTTVNLTAMTVTNFRKVGDGGAINIDSSGVTVTISNSAFTNNTATVSLAGAIKVNNGTFKSYNNIYSGNSSEGHRGGAILFDSGSSTTGVISGDYFYNNSSIVGGAIFGNSPFTADYSAFVGNRATTEDGRGGAIFMDGGLGIVIRNSSFLNNTAVDDNSAAIGGAGTLVGGHWLTLQHVTMRGNMRGSFEDAMLF